MQRGVVRGVFSKNESSTTVHTPSQLPSYRKRWIEFSMMRFELPTVSPTTDTLRFFSVHPTFQCIMNSLQFLQEGIPNHPVSKIHSILWSESLIRDGAKTVVPFWCLLEHSASAFTATSLLIHFVSSFSSVSNSVRDFYICSFICCNAVFSCCETKSRLDNELC